VVDSVPAQFSLAFEPGRVELDSARHGEINHILFARIGQAVGLVGRAIGQQLAMGRAVKEIEGRGAFSRTTHHPLGQLAVPEVLFVGASRGTTGENVSPEPFGRLPAGAEQPAPVINIGRNPCWGRNEEAYGEGPCLTGRIGVAYVKGLQGDDPKYLKLVSTLKHDAVNNVEQGRQQLSATVPERMLHEDWLPHFRDCIVEGQVQSVMASYNAINGVPSNINPLVLTEILKQQWGSNSHYEPGRDAG
jgi:hypothetical protein